VSGGEEEGRRIAEKVAGEEGDFFVLEEAMFVVC
jgi:hypothetical protein